MENKAKLLQAAYAMCPNLEHYGNATHLTCACATYLFRVTHTKKCFILRRGEFFGMEYYVEMQEAWLDKYHFKQNIAAMGAVP